MSQTTPGEPQPEPPFHSIADYGHHDRCVYAADDALLRTKSALENSYCDWEEFRRLLPYMQGYATTPELAQMNIEMLQVISNLIQHLSNVTEELTRTVSLCADVIDTLIIELNKDLSIWKRSQQLAGNGYRQFSVKHLDIIQLRCDSAGRIVGMTSRYIKETESIIVHLTKHYGQEPLFNVINVLRELSAHFKAKLSLLFGTTFLIEEQPPQIMKTNTRFSPQLKVRWLIGNKIHEYFKMSEPKVSVIIINENQANNFVRTNKIPSPNLYIGEISGEFGTLSCDLKTNQCSLIFKNMLLKKIKRAEKKGCESVVDEKFALLVFLRCKVDDSIDVFASAMSLPVTVIVHGNQEAHACATITWDNGTADLNRQKFFDVPDEVPWPLVASFLNMKMYSAVGRELTEQNISYLAEKLFGWKQDYRSSTLTWNRFAKEVLPGRSFTFWDWFYSKMKLTKDHLKELWKEDKIVGFIGKQHAEELLQRCCVGTFMLRFSDSELGGISISCVTTAENGFAKVKSVLPYTNKDLVMKSLPNRLNDLDNLSYLYPDIPKHNAFSDHYTKDPRRTSSNGYYGTVLHDKIVEAGSTNTNALNPPMPNFGGSSPYGGSNASYSGSQPSSPSETVSAPVSNRNSYNSITSTSTQEDQLADLMDVQPNYTINVSPQQLETLIQESMNIADGI
ncbi:signal transducer and activator of transcription 5B-like [Planococcus citri]|uniref:signal transducer and activator of transcription 5B-like n=1 Tax=Planococcus citri TaxID=170843 RepID=UPI0031F9BE4B